MDFDIIIIGAGAAGLMAAATLSAKGKKVAVVEALGRTGGRIHTVKDEPTGTLVALGAEFVHGNLPLTHQLLQEAGAATTDISGSLWQHHNGGLQRQEDFIEDYEVLAQRFNSLQADLPVADFIQKHLQEPRFEELRFSLENYVAGYYAADTKKASTYALRDELGREEETECRIKGGYAVLVHHLEMVCRNRGVPFFLDHTVRQIQWQPGRVDVISDKGSFRGKKVVVTVSVGVLQAGGIRFEPHLPEQMKAAAALGFGHVVKIILQFRQAFWKNPQLAGGKDLHDLQFLFSEEPIPTWWSQHPQSSNQLTGWLGGPRAENLKSAPHDELLQLALESLSRIFKLEPAYLWQDLLGAWSHNWSADPHFHGAYSYEVVQGAAYQKVLQQPVADTIYFAGEGLHHGPEIGTVEAALQSGKAAAEKAGK